MHLLDRADVRGVFFVREPSGSQLVELAGRIDRGEIRPRLGAVYPLAEARAIFRPTARA